MKSVLVAAFYLLHFCVFVRADDDARRPNKCEVCKFLTVELQEALGRSSRSKEVLEVGEVLQTGKRRRTIEYNTSEIRLTEAVDNICERILEYRVHDERQGSLRYSKGSSQTVTELKNLVRRGVKVDLGLPYELWDEPSAEVADMKKQCEIMLEQYEDVVEVWYFRHQDQKLEDFLCKRHVLGADERECLEEVRKGDAASGDAPKTARLAGEL
ncbi:protein canopy 4 [Syngnathoides biaculeatus]|uniref:protein canopy 4 n=1 Tax=Syngnathoides biaculeatus TaxID=300417 RepID=UPI002ADE59E8|nr:protein canopy 4 [Syngnathoides biaculeatus]